MNHAGYLNEPIRNQGLMIKHADRVLSSVVQFDAFVGRGISGAIAVPVLALALGKRFCIVRKPSELESSHSHCQVEGNLKPGDRWIFVDDLIETGATYRAVIKALSNDDHGIIYEHVGSYLYMDQRYRTADQFDRQPSQTFKIDAPINIKLPSASESALDRFDPSLPP